MYLLEHDAKELLAQHGIPIPPGRLLVGDETIYRPALPPGPWIVKGQINTGGRGKAGIIRKADTLQEIANHTYSILGATVKGRRVNSIRIEQRVDAAEECYPAFMVDPAAAGVRVIMSAQGGMEIVAVPSDLVKSAR